MKPIVYQKKERMTSYQTNKNMDCNPKISVIVPVYKVEQYLPHCIDSILTQTFADFELLLIDDGSPDNSGRICDEYANKDTRIRVFHKENGGVSSARNLGLDNTRGEWITFGDADDYFLEDALEILLNYTIKSGAEMVQSNAYRLNSGEYTPILNQKAGIYNEVISELKHFALWGFLLSSQIIRNYKLRFVEDLAFSEDRVFLLEYGLYAKNLRIIDNITYVYRIHPQSACGSTNFQRNVSHQFWAAFLITCLSERSGLSATTAKLLKHYSKLIIESTIKYYMRCSNKLSVITEIYPIYKQHFTIHGKTQAFKYLYFKAYIFVLILKIKKTIKFMIIK